MSKRFLFLFLKIRCSTCSIVFFFSKGVPRPTQRPIMFTNPELGPCGFVFLQSRVVEDAIIYISAQLHSISKDYYFNVRYEDLVYTVVDGQASVDEEWFENRNRIIGEMATFLQLDPTSLQKTVEEVIKPSTSDYTSNFSEVEERTIHTIFNEYRYWPTYEPTSPEVCL